MDNKEIKETKKSRINIYLMTRIALVTAALCICGPFSIPIPISPVPLSLTNFVIFLSLFVLEWKWAFVSTLLYLLIGLVGLPVFSGFSGGVGKLFGPTGGYLIGFLPLVLIAGIIMQLGKNKKYGVYLYFPGILLGEVALYILGTLWLAKLLSVTIVEAMAMAVIPYLPWDAVKICLAFVVGLAIQKALKRANLQ